MKKVVTGSLVLGRLWVAWQLFKCRNTLRQQRIK